MDDSHPAGQNPICWCRRASARLWAYMEVSPSPVYGARLLSGFGT